MTQQYGHDLLNRTNLNANWCKPVLENFFYYVCKDFFTKTVNFYFNIISCNAYIMLSIT